MLDAVSTGLHPSAVIAQLAEKYGVSERGLWSDWQRRESWVPVLLNLEKFAGFVEMVGNSKITIVWLFSRIVFHIFL